MNTSTRKIFLLFVLLVVAHLIVAPECPAQFFGPIHEEEIPDFEAIAAGQECPSWCWAASVQMVAKSQNVEIRKGDILLVRTGWRKTWDEPDASGRLDAAHTKWHQPQPGVGPDSLKFFNDMDIVAVGSDNAALEWGFPPDPKYQRKAFGYLALPIHTDFLWNRGAYIMEILNLDELAKDQAYEFLFVLGPLLLRGGIGVPINPIAIR